MSYPNLGFLVIVKVFVGTLLLESFSKKRTSNTGQVRARNNFQFFARTSPIDVAPAASDRCGYFLVPQGVDGSKEPFATDAQKPSRKG
jgi:hypothetical protein